LPGKGNRRHHDGVQGYVGRTLEVYVVDDHDIVRRGLRDLLAAARDIHVVGDNGSADRAVTEILDLRPDVMLLDVQLEDGTGIEVSRRVRAEDPSVHAVLLTSASDDEALAAAVLAGADDVLVKLGSSSEVLWAVRRIGMGKSGLDPHDRARAVARLRQVGAAPGLGPLDREVLDRMLDGRTDSEIARDLDLTPDEVVASVSRVVSAITGLGSGDAPDRSRPGRHRSDP
jgi:two-component system response regulator DevR